MKTPCKSKSIEKNAFALTGRLVYTYILWNHIVYTNISTNLTAMLHAFQIAQLWA